MRWCVGWFAAIGLLSATPVWAQQAQPAAFTYGTAPLQKLDFYAAASAREPAPLIVFVHGGAWSKGDKDNATGAEKVVHYREQGYAFASIDYRLVPDATVEQQAQDVAAAVAWLIGHAEQLKFDPRRVVLMGHSAGAHLAALVGTDPSYLRKAGLEPDRLRGIVLLDGAAYDVPAQIVESSRFMRRRYDQAFGSDPARQRALSPVTFAAAPNVPSFLILHVERDDGTRQSEALAAALKAVGTKVTLQGLPGGGLRGHVRINRQMGDADYPGTAVVDNWLSATLGPR